MGTFFVRLKWDPSMTLYRRDPSERSNLKLKRRRRDGKAVASNKKAQEEAEIVRNTIQNAYGIEVTVFKSGKDSFDIMLPEYDYLKAVRKICREEFSLRLSLQTRSESGEFLLRFVPRSEVKDAHRR